MVKKSFIDKSNPALQFISGGASDNDSREETPAIEEIPQGYKLDTRYIELKSKRVQLLVQPSIFEKVKAKAKSEGLSVNEFIHKLLEQNVQ